MSTGVMSWKKLLKLAEFESKDSIESNLHLLLKLDCVPIKKANEIIESISFLVDRYLAYLAVNKSRLHLEQILGHPFFMPQLLLICFNFHNNIIIHVITSIKSMKHWLHLQKSVTWRYVWCHIPPFLCIIQNNDNSIKFIKVCNCSSMFPYDVIT